MVKESRRKNLQKLIRNKENIVRNYIKVDDELLETIIKQNQESFMEQATNKSTDNFLQNILPEYPEFVEELFDTIKNNFSHRIDNLNEKKLFQIREQKEPDKQRTPQSMGVQRQRELAPKKNNRIKWSKNEENRIEILLKAGKKPREIEDSINKSRLENGSVQRTDSSIRNKIYRVKK